MGKKKANKDNRKKGNRGKGKGAKNSSPFVVPSWPSSEDAAPAPAEDAAPAPTRDAVPAIELTKGERDFHTFIAARFRAANQCINKKSLVDYYREIDAIIAKIKISPKDLVKKMLNFQREPEFMTWPMRVCFAFLKNIGAHEKVTAEKLKELLNVMFAAGASPYIRAAEGDRLLSYYNKLQGTIPEAKAKIQESRKLYQVFSAIQALSPGRGLSIEQSMNKNESVKAFSESVTLIYDVIHDFYKSNLGERLYEQSGPDGENIFSGGDLKFLHIYIDGSRPTKFYMASYSLEKCARLTVNDSGDIEAIDWDNADAQAYITEKMKASGGADIGMISKNYDKSETLPDILVSSYDAKYLIGAETGSKLILKISSEEKVKLFKEELLKPETASMELDATITIKNDGDMFKVIFSCEDRDNSDAMTDKVAKLARSVDAAWLKQESGESDFLSLVEEFKAEGGLFGKRGGAGAGAAAADSSGNAPSGPPTAGKKA